jgi:hypothetical protein
MNSARACDRRNTQRSTAFQILDMLDIQGK